MSLGRQYPWWWAGSGGGQAGLYREVMKSQPVTPRFEFLIRKQGLKPREVGDEFDAARKFAHFPKPLKAIEGEPWIGEELFGGGYRTALLRDEASEPHGVVSARL